jgi:hypothetical protein
LRELFDDETLDIEIPKFRVSEEYAKIKYFDDFAIALGAMHGLEIVTHTATTMQPEHFKKIGNQTASTIDRDYFLNGFSWRQKSSAGFLGMFDMKSAKSLALSSAVWRAMCAADPDVLKARYVPNEKRRHQEMSKSSFLVDYLSSYAWVPDGQGNYCLPRAVTKETLHPRLDFDNRNGWLTAISFGSDERKRSIEYQQHDERARSLGFIDAEHMKLVLNATAGMSKEDLDRMAREKESATREDFPDKPSANPERRQRLAVERRENAPAREKVQRERSIEPGLSGIKAEAKAYLRGAYTNGNGKLICQCCRDPMPFKLPSTDQDYFEAVLFSREVNKQFCENYLALCPTCAAKYQYACLTSHEDLKESLLAANPDGQQTIALPVTLAEQPATIRFVGAHSLDLKVLLR